MDIREAKAVVTTLLRDQGRLWNENRALRALLDRAALDCPPLAVWRRQLAADMNAEGARTFAQLFDGLIAQVEAALDEASIIQTLKDLPTKGPPV